MAKNKANNKLEAQAKLQHALVSGLIKANNPAALNALEALITLLTEMSTKSTLEDIYNEYADMVPDLAAAIVPRQDKPGGDHSPVYKLKLRKNVHDGQVESFRSFWIKVEADIVNNNALSLDERLRFLWDAVASDDIDLVVGLTIDETKDFLMKKYNSAIAIRQLMIEKIRGLAIHNEYDLAGLKKLSVTAEKLYLAVKFCNEKDALLPELFDLIYNQLPRKLGMSMLKKCNPKDMSKVNVFFEAKIELLVNSSLSYKPHLNQKSPMSSSKNTAFKDKDTFSKKDDTTQKKDEPMCHFCHQPGHFLRDCKDLAIYECKRCGIKGHSAKFCVSNDKKCSPNQPKASPIADAILTVIESDQNKVNSKKVKPSSKKYNDPLPDLLDLGQFENSTPVNDDKWFNEFKSKHHHQLTRSRIL